ELLQLLEPLRAALGAARVQRRRGDLAEERRLARRGRAERTEVARRDAVPEQPRAGRRHVDVAFGVALASPAPVRREQPELLELLRQVARDSGALAEIVELEPLLVDAERRRPPALPLLQAGRVELVLDHAQRQELLALQAEDRPQALEVVLAEEPVAALRPSWREQAFVLEVADLRDRDVRELLREAPDDLADPEQLLPLPLGPRRGRHAMKVILYLPICTSSPSSSRALSIRRRLTKVPFSDP